MSVTETSVDKYVIEMANERGPSGPAGGPTDILDAMVLLAAAKAGSPKGVYATLVALQTAFPTGDTSIYVVAADGHWYYWSGSAWTDGGTYQATEIANGGVKLAKINADVSAKFTGNAFNIKPSSGVTAYARYVFDTYGLSLADNSTMTLLFNLFSTDANVVSVSALAYMSNSETTPSPGATTDLAGPFAVTPGQLHNFYQTIGYFNATYRYVHLIIPVTLTTAQLSAFAIDTVYLNIGGELPPLIMVYMDTADATSTRKAIDYLDTSLVNVASAPEITQGEIDKSLVRWDRIHIKTDPAKFAANYLFISVLFDLEPYFADLAGQSGIEIKCKILSADNRIVNLYASCYLQQLYSAAIPAVYDTVSSKIGPRILYKLNTTQEVVFSQSWSYANANNYKYLNVFFVINTSDMASFYDLWMGDPLLKIGAIEIPACSQVLPEASFCAEGSTSIVDFNYPASASGIANWYRTDKTSPKIVLVGDSTSDEDLEPPAGNTYAIYDQLGYHVNSGDALDGCTIVNMGASGNPLSYFLLDTPTVAGRGISDVIALQADMYIFSYGINDVRSGATSCSELIAMMKIAIEKLLASTKGFILLRTPNGFLADTPEGQEAYITPSTAYQKYTDILWNAYEYFRNKYDRVEVIDMQARIFGRTCQTLANSPLMNDKVHPNADGYKAVADELAEYLHIPKPVIPWKARAALAANPTAPWTTYPKILENGNYRQITSGYFVALTGTYCEFESYSGEAAKIQAGDIVKIGDARAFVVTGTVSNNGTNIRITQAFADTTNDSGMVTVFRNE